MEVFFGFCFMMSILVLVLMTLSVSVSLLCKITLPPALRPLALALGGRRRWSSPSPVESSALVFCGQLSRHFLSPRSPDVTLSHLPARSASSCRCRASVPPPSLYCRLLKSCPVRFPPSTTFSGNVCRGCEWLLSSRSLQRTFF